MCGILINNQEFNIEKTKYILSDLIANRKQMDEEVICSTVGQTILWANKGDEIKHKIFFSLFLFSFSAASIDHITLRMTSTLDQRIFNLLLMIIKDNQGFRVQLQGHVQNFTLLYITCITDDGIPLKHYHSTEGFHPVV